jgi:Acetyltransferase (GNAT) family
LIRAATEADLPDIVRLGRQSLIDGPYAGIIKDNPEHAAQLALSVIQGRGGRILLLEIEKRVVGLLGFFIFVHYFTGEPTATEIMWYVEPESRIGIGGLELMWEAEKQAKEMGATWMGFTAPNEAVGEFYERRKYRKMETTYAKEL